MILLITENCCDVESKACWFNKEPHKKDLARVIYYGYNVLTLQLQNPDINNASYASEVTHEEHLKAI